MLKPTLARLILLCVVAAPVVAQTPGTAVGVFGEKPMDPAQMTALMANSRRTMRPASFVLGYKEELALTPQQVQKLDALVRGEDDSAVVRQFRLTALMTRIMKKREAGYTANQAGWAGPVDEKQVRDEACEQAGVSAEAMLNLMRDRQAVGNILTGRQIDRIQELEMSDIARVLRPKEP